MFMRLTLAGLTQMTTYGGGCDSRKMEIFGNAGAEANFFGFAASLASAKLFDKTIYASRPRGCG